jgi:hypothetical protein
MNVAPADSKKVLRLFLLFQIILFTPIVVGSFFGCARTVETEVVHDTDTVVQHDTTNFDGPAWIRFVNLLTRGGVIILKTELGTSISPFASATQIMTKEFVPIHSDSSLVLYTEYYIGPEFHVDSLTIPSDSLTPLSLNTIALFQIDQDGTTRIAPFFANDSLRKVVAPPGKTYFRFINGIADHPQPSPAVNLYLDDPQGKPLFLDNSGTTSRPINFLELRNYLLIPAGVHTIYVRKDGDDAILYQSQKTFRAGGYYTAKLTGSKTVGNDAFAIDEE